MKAVACGQFLVVGGLQLVVLLAEAIMWLLKQFASHWAMRRQV